MQVTIDIPGRYEPRHRENASLFIAKQPGTRKTLDTDKLKAEDNVCVKEEHPFHYIKQVFSYGKVHYLARSRTKTGYIF